MITGSFFGRSSVYVGKNKATIAIAEAFRLIKQEAFCKAVYIEAGGGLGKTFLLQNSHLLIEDQEQTARVAKLVDFYDTDTRRGSSIEQRLIVALTADANESYRYTVEQIREAFGSYLETRHEYNIKRRLLTPAKRKEQGDNLRRLFIEGLNQLNQCNPLVLCFDTTELLANPPPIHDFLGDTIPTSAAIVAEWFTAVLPQLQHTLVIFCGRPYEPGQPLLRNICQQLGILYPERRLLIEEISYEGIEQYLRAYDREDLLSQVDNAYRCTKGRPLLLTIWIQLHSSQIPLPGSAQLATPHAFQRYVLEQLFNPYALSKPRQFRLYVLAYCLYVLTFARRGITPQQLEAILRQDDWPVDYQNLDERQQQIFAEELESLPQNALVKYRQGLLYLHDEIYLMLDQSGMPQAIGLEDQVLKFLIDQTEQQLAASTYRDQRYVLLSNVVYYRLSFRIDEGYREYTLSMYRLFSELDPDHALLLRDEFWRWLNYTIERSDEEGLLVRAQPNRNRVIESELTLDEVRRDDAVWVVKFLFNHHQNEEAIRIGTLVRQRYQAILEANADDYFKFDLLLAIARAQIAWRDESLNEALQLLDEAIAVLERGAPAQQFLRDRLAFFYGDTYNLAGYARRRLNNYVAAAEAYEQAMRFFFEYRKQGNIDLPLNEALTQTIVNYIFVATQQGHLLRARILARDLRNDPAYPTLTPDRQALVLNITSIVLLRSGDLAGALRSVREAEEISKQLQSQRVYAQVAAQIAAVYSERLRQSDELADNEAEDYFTTAIHGFTGIEETASLRETLLEYGKYWLRLGRVYRRKGQTEEAFTAFNKALESLLEARKILNGNQPSIAQAEIGANIAIVYRVMGNNAQAEKLLDEIEATIGELPSVAYVQLVAADIALTRAQIALSRNQWEEAVQLSATALARAACFSTEETTVGIFRKRIEDFLSRLQAQGIEHMYPHLISLSPSPQLPYHPPDAVDWDREWQQASLFLRSIGEVIALSIGLP